MRYGSLYIQDLERYARDENEKRKAAKPSSLRQQVLDWHNSLPPISRDRPLAMSEIEQALKKPGRLLSAHLLALGWRRKRKWSGNGQYPRYWLPPGG